MISRTVTPARSKVKDLNDLAAVLGPVRARSGKIVHCHGVFDLLHIGHIRHLEQAKAFGDVLAVTITPDRYVNKGPHRPVFAESLRAEAVAALDCVDYVAVNHWPTAVDTIGLLEPDFYVKGPDYKDAAKDRTGGIVLEEEAIAAVGGQLVCTEDITFSSSTLINRYVPVFSREVGEYLEDFRSRYRADDVLGYLERAQQLKVLVVGEAIIDEYQYCTAIGKSSKEPMLALRRLSTETFAGGILAVGNNVANFSNHTSLLTCLGSENSYEDFIRERLNENINATLLRRHGTPTIVKRRFVEQYFFIKLLEVYEMADEPIAQADNEALCAALERALPEYDLVIVADFGHGMLSREAVDLLSTRSRSLAVNAQSNAGNTGYHTISRYPRADFVCLAEPEMRLETRERSGDLAGMARELSARMQARTVFVTRGKYGCVCYDRDAGTRTPPALAGPVVDRMGAGDAFFSVVSLCVAQGAPVEIAGFIGNVVGANAVATVGHRRSIERLSLFRHIESLLK